MGFNECIGPLLDAEGRIYEKVPGDSGGATFCGLDSKDDVAWPGWPMVYADIAVGRDPAQNPSTMAAVNSWYFNKYWLPAQLDYFPEALQDAAFGCAVNQGVVEMALTLQRALNRTGQTLIVDGNLGPSTLKAINNAPLGWLEDAFKLARIWVYLATEERNPKDDAQFLDGWERRVQNGE